MDQESCCRALRQSILSQRGSVTVVDPPAKAVMIEIVRPCQCGHTVIVREWVGVHG